MLYRDVVGREEGVAEASPFIDALVAAGALELVDPDEPAPPVPPVRDPLYRRRDTGEVEAAQGGGVFEPAGALGEGGGAALPFDVPTPGAGQDGFGWVYDHGTGAVVWTELVTREEFVEGAGGRLLDYKVNTVGHGTAAAAFEDIAGLVSTFTVEDRPVIVTLRAPVLTGNTAAARPRLQLVNASGGPVTPSDGSPIANNGLLDYMQATMVSANEHHPCGTLEVCFPAGAGTVTVKAQLGVFSGGGTATILCAGGGRMSLKVIEG